MIPLSWYMYVSAGLFSIGLFGVLARKNAVTILMGVELMLNAVNINMIAFWRYLSPGDLSGWVFTAMAFVVAAAEVSVGLALILSVYRNRKTVVADEIDMMKW